MLLFSDCNYTCSDKMSCGGVTSYSTYYVIGIK